jgi:hypothetical protein
MIKKINNVKPVHIRRWLKGVFVSGDETSGKRGVKGLMRSRKRRPLMIAGVLLCGSSESEGQRND